MEDTEAQSLLWRSLVGDVAQHRHEAFGCQAQEKAGEQCCPSCSLVRANKETANTSKGGGGGTYLEAGGEPQPSPGHHSLTARGSGGEGGSLEWDRGKGQLLSC